MLYKKAIDKNNIVINTNEIDLATKKEVFL